ncbi:winged helix-turn-helix domain-containing protein [Streptomyces sp. FZ201]|uniref:GntR family transcriptional regulator n=1 Tax=Streptomyces sp. FZ201 TaxID=3057122 RepID=UPI0021C1C4A6|nr:winged helix-turn-helix domain-containing protein [Streptomyces sp. FZ201]
MASEVQRIVDALLGRIADGVYPVDALLPTQRELAREFQVSRDTVVRALRQLADEGYVESRQGSGTRVVRSSRGDVQSAGAPRRSVTMRSALEAAFAHPTVTVDVFTLTGETLDTHVRLCAERVRLGEVSPRSIRLRVLTPRIGAGFKLASPVDGSTDTRGLTRLRQLRERHMASLATTVHDLRLDYSVSGADFEWRDCPVAPMQKLYLFNDSDVLTGFYEVIRRPVYFDDEEPQEIHDVLGLGARLHHYSSTGEGHDGVDVVALARRWFDHMWSNADPASVD